MSHPVLNLVFWCFSQSLRKFPLKSADETHNHETLLPLGRAAKFGRRPAASHPVRRRSAGDVPIWTCLAVSSSLGIQCGMRGILSIGGGALPPRRRSRGRSVESTDHSASQRSAARSGPCHHVGLSGSEVLCPICFCVQRRRRDARSPAAPPRAAPRKKWVRQDFFSHQNLTGVSENLSFRFSSTRLTSLFTLTIPLTRFFFWYFPTVQNVYLLKRIVSHLSSNLPLFNRRVLCLGLRRDCNI